jgi:3-oxoadipate enol-lactonase
MPYVVVDGCRLHYEWAGQPGSPVVLLSHSVGTALGMWDEQTARLSRDFHVLRYDSRGHGQSGAPDGPYTIERLGLDASALIEALKIPQAHVCGLSLGGMVGMWLAVNRPQQVGRLILSNTSAKLGPRQMWDDRIAAIHEGGIEAVADVVLSRWFTDPFRAAAPGTVARFRRMLVATPVPGYIAGLEAIRDMDQEASLGRIVHRTLVIVGTDDPATPPAHGEMIAGRIPDAALVSLTASHLSNVEQAADFNECMIGFLMSGEAR